MSKKKIIRIGFDLDGVIIDKPPFMPKTLIEWLVKSHKTKRLSYRYPESKYERKLRYYSHHPIFRPPIAENIKLIKLVAKKNVEIFIITSRYDFLETRTNEWFDFYKLNGLFSNRYLNLKNKQPYNFKIKTIKKLGLEIFVDDDKDLVEYMSSRVKKTKIISVNEIDKLSGLIK